MNVVSLLLQLYVAIFNIFSNISSAKGIKTIPLCVRGQIGFKSRSVFFFTENHVSAENFELAQDIYKLL